jgi:hypothetical protein
MLFSVFLMAALKGSIMQTFNPVEVSFYHDD